MSKLLEIFGKGITINTAEVIWSWATQIISGMEAMQGDRSLFCIIEHLLNRELVQAEQKLGTYLRSHPECILGRMIAASWYLLQNEPQEAIQQAQSVYYRQPGNTMALYVLGLCHERLGHVEQALEFYQDCIKFKSFLQLPRQRMAAIYLKEGFIDKATYEYEMLTSEHPDDITSLVLLGYLYLASGKDQQAIDTFNLAIVSHPDNYMSASDDSVDETYVQADQYESAMQNIMELIEKMGPQLDLIIRMADLYSRINRDTEAITCYEHAVKIEPNSLEATIKLGTHYLRNSRFILAAEQFNRASEINDEILDAYLGLATAHNDSGNRIEAMQTLYLANSILQNSVMLFSESAMLNFQTAYDDHTSPKTLIEKDIVTTDDVIKAYQKQLKSHKDHPDVHYKYGLLMVSERNHPMAVSAFQNTLALNPIHYRARHKMVLCLYESHRKEHAIEVLSKNNLCGRSDFEKYYQVALLFANRAAFKKAMKKFQTLHATRCFEFSHVQENIEILLENLGLIDRTDTCWERINRDSKSLIEIKDARAVTEFLS